MELQTVSFDDIYPAAYNPRVDLKPGDPEYERLKLSIKEFGYVEPLVWNKRTGNLVGGHQRFKVLLQEGHEEAEVSVVDLSEEQEKTLNLGLNKISGDWDMPKLKDLLEELDTGMLNMELTGFDEDELESLMTQYHTDDEDADEDADEDGPRTAEGQVWALGNHRLFVGETAEESDADVIIRKWEQYTGKTAALEDDTEAW